MVPMRNEAVAVTELPEGLVRLAYPLAVKPWFGRLADKVGLWDGSPMTKTVELDEMGTFVWRHIDGERSVRDIAEAFAETYQVQPRESELAVTAFIKTIGQRGIIGLK
ncbi:Coenzyme PQQ synthesis protein D [Pseudodesulfovibrio hydrargyri]|uniref:Coenzyme PQQ synthesis protein D n=2 Tax=Pseudodesulfovibrio hydrargyri TaxID=2125990 RepID=A0A1J5MUR5_9BACT|nr:Coenzyme PQQ synthesis protein D [Pseudodesulfovibrio hydrargyri]